MNTKSLNYILTGKRSKMDKVIAFNRKATHGYDIQESLEAGLVLTGTEVKSIREGKANLKDSFIKIDRGEAFLMGCHISPYSHGNIYNHDPLRDRKLLLHKREINRLYGKIAEKGLTLVPLKLYFKDGYVKIEVALAKGKKLFDKREAIKHREAKRELEREFRERQK